MAATKIAKSRGSAKNDDYALLNLRKTIASRYLDGKSQFEIGAELGITQPTVSYHLAKIKEEWLSSTLRDFDEAKAQELAKIDHLEEMAWQSFHKSCQDAYSKQQKKALATSREHTEDDEGNVVSENVTKELVPVEEKEITRKQAGDPRFLDKVAWCIDYRCKLLGIHKENPTNVNQLVINFDQLFGRPDIEDPVEKRIAEVSAVKPLPAHNGASKKGK